jgi:beta-glucosidase
LELLNIRNFCISLSWPRLIPEGAGQKNEKGIDFYNRVIDFCLECGIEPWITLYHWDIPQALEEKGGWTEREIIHWFEDYVAFCIRQFGDRVKHWMVLNEPMAFTGAGYFLGIHAPGKKGLANFLPAVHHAALCQSIGARTIKSFNGRLQVGSTFSCSPVDLFDDSMLSAKAAQRVDVLMNRLFIEPLLGLGYPWEDLRVLEQLEKHMIAGDEALLETEMDFVGLQHYTREVVAQSAIMPYLNARIVKASKRGVPLTTMDWKIYPEGFYRILNTSIPIKTFQRLLLQKTERLFKTR